jgi:hypothetical protein
MKYFNVHGSILDNNHLRILKIHLGSPGNPPRSYPIKNTISTVSFCSTFCSAFPNTCLNSQCLTQLVDSKENKLAKPFLTSKQGKISHGVPDGYEIDVGNFDFAPGCLQPIQPRTLLLN